MAMECVELVNLYSKTRWYEFRDTYDEDVSLVSNYYKEFTNNILSNTESRNV